MPPAIWRGRSGRRCSICAGGVQSGHSRLALIWVAPLQEKLATHADGIAQRLAVAEHEIESALRRTDDDGAGFLTAGVTYYRACRRGTEQSGEKRAAAAANLLVVGIGSPSSIPAPPFPFPSVKPSESPSLLGFLHFPSVTTLSAL